MTAGTGPEAAAGAAAEAAATPPASHPLPRPGPHALGLGPAPVPAADAAATRVMLVEDNPGDARLVVGALERAGLKGPRSCASAEEALAELERAPCDVVLVDQGLPGMTGLQLGAKLRERDATVGLVMLTGAGDERLAVTALKSGFDDYVVKDVRGAYRELLPLAIADVARRHADRRAKEQAERALKESEERYSLAVRGANDAIWDWDLRSDRLYLSPRWKDLLGLESAEEVGPPAAWFDRVHRDDAPGLQKDLQAHLQGLTPHLKTEVRVRHANGGWRWLLVRGLCVRDGLGRPQRMAGSLTDITERRLIEERLLHDAQHDPLTGLANRARFLERLRLALRHVRAEPGSLFAVFFLDLDGFKVVNDSLGHLSGDQLLVAFARRLERAVRPGDSLCRLGGDEFAVLAEGLRARDEAEALADSMRRDLSQPFEVDGRELFASASIGIAFSDPRYQRAEDMLRDADTAMYRAKGNARASWRVFETSMHDVAASRLELENDLRRALDRGELMLHYQPIVRIDTGKLTGFEALIRWQHPKRGMVEPDRFIAIAEETGLISAIGAFSFEAACLQVRHWQRQFPGREVYVAVNLSAKQFAEGDLVRDLGRILRDTGAPASALRLEMTESALLSSQHSVAARLWQLRALGVGLALDDFGTGYSSLAYLRHFPIDALKIEKSFVKSVAEGGQDATIVRTIVQLADSLGMDVVAEGVETPEQLDWLRQCGCPHAQGWLFGRATAPEEATALLTTNPTW